jgi:hypothetical protein
MQKLCSANFSKETYDELNECEKTDPLTGIKANKYVSKQVY